MPASILLNGELLMSQCSGNAIDHEVELHYYTGIRNFGDELSPYLISKITGRKVSLASSEEGLYAIGSILTHKALWSSCVVGEQEPCATTA